MDRQDAVMQCSIIKMYGKCGSVGNARGFFDRIASSSVWCWTAMIGAYAQNGHVVEAMEMFHRMVLEGVRPVESTFVLVLSACTTLDHAEAIHARVLEAGSQGENLEAALVSLYAGFGRIDQATRTFERMSTKNAECWGCLIAAMAKEGDKARALELYQEWWSKKNDSELSKSASIFAAALSACSSVDEVQEIESHIRAFSAKSSLSEEVGAALVTFFARWGSVDDSSRVFESLKLRDIVTWNAMLGAYVQLGHSRAAIGFYYRMNLEGILADSFTFSSILGTCSDLCDLELGKRVHQRAVSIGQANLVVKNALLRMYARCARLDYARRVFEEVVGARDSGSWNSMISGYVQAGCPREALELFHRMDVEPSVATYGSVLEACSSLGELDQAKAVHGRFVSAGLESEVVDTTLVKLLAGAGFVGDARRVFESCKSSRKDPVSWNVMIAAYAQHGDMAEVTDLYRRMNLEGCSSGTVTFVSILIGCSRAGLLEESIYQFGSMSSDHWIRPVVEHFVCVVDLLGRAGRLDEAEELVETMPVESRLKFGAWKSLLAGCKIHRTSEEALRRIESRSRASCGDERPVLGTLWRSL
ncbi:pentatricopeptide repeat-containing protein At3g53360, mitochondrial-like [Selaginella moellendorffii]|uniref:pentatricopeptide repeat-containing protein At3g53360, mitochondrial-like n=1 Tax=Selaginella moellendorffii TaxID=88036 RepID=UPI000D1CD301|nr:pentatricopeptide repeat-containing protein At3g53360, mitochondrial-like [Selaginella moellendorffii]|eukprot:XP_024522348.1 pentatricopeptide repeat-containing protein At3g53360, mitochondrial-like [Selaginella moellendorffii]